LTRTNGILSVAEEGALLPKLLSGEVRVDVVDGVDGRLR
jgi:hypothetical protein